jgi:RNA polymerase sigma factor (sigma-70 family)
LDRLYEDYEYEIADSSESPLDTLIKKEFKEKVKEAVSELGPIDQQIVISFMNGISEREIAKEIGISQKAVNKRKTKLFKELKEKLEIYH